MAMTVPRETFPLTNCWARVERLIPAVRQTSDTVSFGAILDRHSWNALAVTAIITFRLDLLCLDGSILKSLAPHSAIPPYAERGTSFNLSTQRPVRPRHRWCALLVPEVPRRQDIVGAEVVRALDVVCPHADFIGVPLAVAGLAAVVGRRSRMARQHVHRSVAHGDRNVPVQLA